MLLAVTRPPTFTRELIINTVVRLCSALFGAFVIGLISAFATLAVPCSWFGGTCGYYILIYAAGLGLLAFVSSFILLLWLRFDLSPEAVNKRWPNVSVGIYKWCLALLVLFVFATIF